MSEEEAMGAAEPNGGRTDDWVIVHEPRFGATTIVPRAYIEPKDTDLSSRFVVRLAAVSAEAWPDSVGTDE